MPPLDIRVPDDCGGEVWEPRWGRYVGGGAAVPTSETRKAWIYHVMGLHERFEAYERSREASAARTAAHDDIKVLFAALARNAGAIAVAMEPRGWDAGGATDRHKRPLARARAALVTEGVRCRQQVAGDGQRDPEVEEKRVSMQYRA